MRVAEMAGPDHADIARHLRSVGELAGEIALELTGDATFASHVATAGPLHDIGKLGLRDDLIWKPGPLDHDEYEAVKEHPMLGARILAGGSSECSRMAEEVARCHHERWDGHGYPAGLCGTDIPLAAHALEAVKGAVADSGLKMEDIDGLSTYPELPASGHAEVDFVGIDGRTYRARWSVRRARSITCQK